MLSWIVSEVADARGRIEPPQPRAIVMARDEFAAVARAAPYFSEAATLARAALASEPGVSNSDVINAWANMRRAGIDPEPSPFFDERP